MKTAKALSIYFSVIILLLVLSACSAPESKPVSVGENPVGESPAGEEEIKPEAEAQVISPLDNPDQRVRLKKFGDYISPENSPVSPERFRGWHTGIDFEVFPDEMNRAVAVKAVCDGKVLEKKWVSGYGGVLVESCEIDGEAVTVLYGHLRLESITAEIGETIAAGAAIGNLGADNSRETDQERKHLHLSIHRGQAVNLRGYVDTEAELKDWIDPCLFFCRE